MVVGAENIAVKSGLLAAESDLRTAAPDVAADLARQALVVRLALVAGHV
ncbi:hypothetical protein [Microbispora maris]